ncbi:MAG TPA: dTMP kinase [Candidatus Woesebacteria bacterium]|nr:dTMP kinase [Candidatus Woesebacteria bacterium]
MVEHKKPFVVAEGGSGVGKTTAVEGIKNELPNWKFFREPGGTDFGEAMRDAVQMHKDWEIDPIASMFGYSASRANLVMTKVLPIVEGKVEADGVFLDRYWYTTYTYQGGGEKIDREIIIAVSKIATKGLNPDLVLHYDLLPELAIARKTGCSDVDRYDMKELDFHRRARDAYLELSHMFPDFWKVIDASQSKEKVLADSLNTMKEFGMI